MAEIARLQLEKAGGFLRSVRQYSNILLARGEGQYGFIHLTLEEMLAAYGVVQKGQVELEESLAFIQEMQFAAMLPSIVLPPLEGGDAEKAAGRSATAEAWTALMFMAHFQ